MEQAFHILVIILSAALFVLLVLAIIATVFVVKLVKKLRGIVEVGDSIAHKAERAVDNVAASVSATNIITTIGKIVSFVKK